MEKSQTSQIPKIGAMGSEIYSRDVTAFEGETGSDRVKMIFQESMFGEKSIELQMVWFAATAGGITGATIGGMMRSQDAKEEFIRQNKETLFSDPKVAIGRMRDKMFLEIMKGGMRYGLKFAAFTGGYTLLTTVIATYRNDGGFIEHVIAGSVLGSLSRINLGLRGMLAGGVLGLALGTTAGCLMSAGLYFTGNTIKEIRYWQHEYWHDFMKKHKEAIEAAKQKSET